MKQLISPAEMLAAEKHYFETSGVPSINIMEKAALALSRIVLTRFPGAKRICIACGPGGNGGDGYACARMLAERDKKCLIFAPAAPKSPDTIENARRAAECGVDMLEADRLQGMPVPDVWIDCLYGTGLSRAPEGAAAAIIRRINADREKGCKVIACDIPSGLNGETGRAYEPCVYADITLTFQLPKYGHYLQDGLDACGEIVIADVGFPEKIFSDDLPWLFGPEDLRELILPRKRNIHKGSCGRLLIIAGSVGMAGAAALCAKAALRSGAGLVTIACPEEILPILQIHAPGALCLPLPQRDGAISAEALPIIKEAFSGKDAVAIGPGLSRKAPPELLRAVLESGLPTVIDADALNIIAENPQLKSLLDLHHVLTPHPGEAARLLGRKIESPVADALELSETGAVVVLKGASRVIARDGHADISATGASGMARGGSGDVFTGILGALLADTSLRLPSGCALCACEIHGLAGKLAQEKYGAYAMNAADIIEFLPEVFKTHAE